MRFAVRWILKERERKLLVSEADVEQNQARVGIIDDDVLNGKPEKELLLGETDDSNEAAVAEIGGDDAVEVNSGLELGEARPVQEYLEAAIGIEGVGPDGLWQEPRWEATGAEEVVDGVDG